MFITILCDSENRYLGNPLRGTCYYSLLIDYQFTFSLIQEDDRHHTAINFIANPEQSNKNLDISINASNNFNLNITWSIGSTGTGYDYTFSPEKDNQKMADTETNDYEYIVKRASGHRMLEEPSDPDLSGNVSSWFRSQVQDIPMWLLGCILVAASGIVVLLVFGCVCLTRTYLNQRSKMNEIVPLIEEVIGENTSLRMEKEQHYMPSADMMEEILEKMLEEKSLHMQKGKT